MGKHKIAKERFEQKLKKAKEYLIKKVFALGTGQENLKWKICLSSFDG